MTTRTAMQLFQVPADVLTAILDFPDGEPPRPACSLAPRACIVASRFAASPGSCASTGVASGAGRPVPRAAAAGPAQTLVRSSSLVTLLDLAWTEYLRSLRLHFLFAQNLGAYALIAVHRSTFSSSSRSNCFALAGQLWPVDLRSCPSHRCVCITCDSARLSSTGAELFETLSEGQAVLAAFSAIPRQHVSCWRHTPQILHAYRATHGTRELLQLNHQLLPLCTTAQGHTFYAVRRPLACRMLFGARIGGRNTAYASRRP